MRKLTPEEEAFIEVTLSNRNEELVSTDEGHVVVKKNNKVKYKKFGFINAKNLAIAAISLSFITNGFFIYYIVRAEALLGKDMLNWLSNNEIDPKMLAALKKVGLEDLPKYIEIYENRAMIIASIFTIGVVLATLILLIDYFIKTRGEQRI